MTYSEKKDVFIIVHADQIFSLLRLKAKKRLNSHCEKSTELHKITLVNICKKKKKNYNGGRFCMIYNL